MSSDQSWPDLPGVPPRRRGAVMRSGEELLVCRRVLAALGFLRQFGQARRIKFYLAVLFGALRRRLMFPHDQFPCW